MRTGNGYTLTDLNGNLLTEDRYYSLYAEKGYITGVDLLGDELNGASALFADNTAAVSLVSSAVTLLQLDPATNAASVIMLIETIIGLL